MLKKLRTFFYLFARVDISAPIRRIWLKTLKVVFWQVSYKANFSGSRLKATHWNQLTCSRMSSLNPLKICIEGLRYSSAFLSFSYLLSSNPWQFNLSSIKLTSIFGCNFHGDFSETKVVQKVRVHHQVQVVIDVVASLAHVKLGPFCPIAKNQDPISRSIEGSLLVFLWRKVGSTIFASSQKSRYLLANMTRRPKKVGRKLLFKAHFFIKSQ